MAATTVKIRLPKSLHMYRPGGTSIDEQSTFGGSRPNAREADSTSLLGGSGSILP